MNKPSSENPEASTFPPSQTLIMGVPLPIFVAIFVLGVIVINLLKLFLPGPFNWLLGAALVALAMYCFKEKSNH